MDARCRIELLGGLRVLQGGRLITRFNTQKTAALLAYLAYHRQTPHPREALIELFWSDSAPNAGRASLSMALSSLRHQLEPPGVSAGAIIVADRNNVGLNSVALTTDVAEFETAIKAASRDKDGSQRLQHLTDAVEQYRGQLLPGYYEDWVSLEQNRLEEVYLQALHRIVSLCEQAGDGEAAISFSRRIIAVDPLREEAYRDLMRLYAKSGQPRQALRQYRELERLLVQELGDTPAPETRALARQIERDRALLTQSVEPDLVAEGKKRKSATPSLTLPTGTVTFLMTDIEGSTALWEHTGDAFQEALHRHHVLLREVFARFNGHEVHEMGDGFLVAFAGSTPALACAVECQRVLLRQEWPEVVGNPPVRMGLFTGEVEIKNGAYYGLALHRASRLLAATGHGGQILCAEATAVLVRRDLAPELRLTDLGYYRLRDVAQAEHLYQVDYPEMPRRDFPALRAEPEAAGNLPLTLTRFFGRGQELARLREMLQEPRTRLITLTGPGGTGKTRLSLECAAQQREAFGGAVWFTPLADTRDENQIVSALVSALQLTLHPEPEPLEQVITLLSRQSALMVLDNFEQVVEVGSRIVETLLARVPSLKLMITSRKRLNVTGEREFPVPPLPIPNGADTPERLSLFESVQLFVDRAQMVRPDFQVTGHNAASVAELCDRLEGIPLAIELAASRAQTFTPLQMLAQLENRFVFLTGSRRGVEERHRTLAATLDWSFRLLSPEIQWFFARLSVFRGGWTVEAAEAVCDEPLALDYLTQLQECSLVRTVESGEAMRYQMLETMREYAAEQLSPEARMEIGSHHADHFLALAEAPGASEWLMRLETEHNNLRAALDWYASDAQSAEAGLRLAYSLHEFWYERGYHIEGRTRLEEALAHGIGTRESLRASALKAAGWLSWSMMDLPAADRFFQESLGLYRKLERKEGIGYVLVGIGNVARDQGDFERARALFEESATLGREVGNNRLLADSLHHLGWTVLCQGDYALARRLFEEGRVIRQATGDINIVMALWWLGVADLDMGDTASAQAHLQEGLHLAFEKQHRYFSTHFIEAFAWLATALGQSGRGARLFGAAHTLYQAIGHEFKPLHRARHNTHEAAARAALGKEAFTAAWAEGEVMTLEQAVAYALKED